MKVLFIAHRIPYPPNKGDKIRSFFMLKHLSEKHEVYLAYLIDDKHDLVHVSSLSKYCKEMIFAFIDKRYAYFKMFLNSLRGRALSLAYFGSEQLTKKVEIWLKENQFDLIYVFSSGVAQYTLHIKDIPIIMDYVDVDSNKWEQNAEYAGFPMNYVYRREAVLLREYERLIAGHFDKNVFVTERDRDLFKSLFKDKDSVVISNGVDLEYFSRKTSCERIEITDSLTNIVFTGAMDYFANEDAALHFYKNILPLLKNRVRFLIVGSNPSKKLRRLSNGNDCIVTGRVNDIRPYLNMAQVYVAPLRISRGVQNKVLEAMSYSLPVVTTSHVLDGVRARPGVDLLVADNARDFASAVNLLLDDKNFAQSIANSGRRFVEANYSWDFAYRQLDKLIEELCPKR